MKVTTFSFTLFVFTCLGACGGSDADASPLGKAYGKTDATISVAKPVQVVSLSSDETSGLLFMREEEKLARDIYLSLFDHHSLTIFRNISGSEQSHMDAMKNLLDKYGLTDPVGGNAEGVFVNAELQSLYDYLLGMGSASPLDALYVGAAIEELDISDLQQLLSEVSGNDDIISVYGNLLRGSRNHLRSFHAQIELNSGSYTPIHISQAEYNAIVNSPMERGGRN